MAVKMGVWWTVGILLTGLIAWGWCFEIISEVQVLERLPGNDQSVTFDCTVEGPDYDAYTHVIEWQKRQLRDDSVGVDVAVFKSFRGVFTTPENTARMSINKTERTTPTARITLALTIKKLKHEDSGWYRCLIRDQGFIVKSVEHRLYVFAPVQSIRMFGYPKTSEMPENGSLTTTTTPQSLAFMENENGYIECRSYGGLPKPVLRIIIDERQVTTAIPDVSPDEPTLEGPVVGLQRILYTGLRMSRTYRPTANYDGKAIKCRAEIIVNGEQQAPMETMSILNIQGSPLFHNCTSEVKARVGMQNIKLYCSFVSKPQWEDVQWMGITHQEQINGASPGESTTDENGYQAYTKQLPGNSMYEATLVFPTVRAHHFQSYKLIVKNQIDTEETMLKLIQGTPDGGRGEGSSGAPTLIAATWLSTIMLITSVTLSKGSC